MTEVRWLRAADRAAHHAATVEAARSFARRNDRLVTLRHLATGAPYIEIDGQPRLGVSLARTGHFAAVAISDDPIIGVDIEGVPPEGDLDEQLVRRVFSAEEQARGPIGPVEFAVGWTRKEAVLKAWGGGLTLEPARLTLPPVELGRGGPVTLPDGRVALMCSWLVTKDLALSVCTADASLGERVNFSPLSACQVDNGVEFTSFS